MSTPQEILDDARGYASDIQREASGAIAATMSSIANQGNSGQAIPDFQDLDSFEPPTIPRMPNVPEITLVTPEEPDSRIRYQDISQLEIGLIPEFDIPVPIFHELDRPNQLGEFSEAPPTINTEFVFPAPPRELDNPHFQMPELTPGYTVGRPELGLPEIALEAPTFDSAEPQDLSRAAGDEYRNAAPQFIAMVNGYVDAQLTDLNPQFHAQMARIETQLQKYLDGGTGLKTEIEDAIYSRARAKNDVEAKRVQDATFADTAARGFTLPSGAMTSAMARARQEAANNNAKAANEIAIAQAEMEQKNLQFAVTTSAALRATVTNAVMGYMQTLVQINGQALDHAKTVLGAIVEGFNSSVKAYSARVEAYRAAAALFEVKLKAAATKLELYRGEIQAMEAVTNVDRLKVDIYKTQVDALTSLSALYKSQVDTVLSKANMEKLKLDLYQAQVQSYGALVQAKEAEWRGYAAQINGQQAQAGLFGAQVQGYSAQIQGFKTKLEAQSEVVRAQIATNQAAADQVKTSAAIFQTIVQARGGVASVQADLEKLKLENYSRALEAEISKAKLGLDYYKTKNMLAVDAIGKRIEAASVTSQAATARMQALGTVGVAGGNILGSLAGAAMSGINVLAASTETI